jgi:hypothetical protein
MSVKDVSLERVSRSPSTRIASVVLPVTIEGLTLITGQEVTFAGRGGTFDRKTRNFSGRTKEAEAVQVILDSVRWILLREATIDGARLQRVDRSVFESDSKMKPWKQKSGHSMQPGEKVVFDYGGGAFDPSLHAVTGVTDSGRSVTLDVDSLYGMESRQFDVVKSASSTLLWGLVIPVGLFLILLATDDDPWD